MKKNEANNIQYSRSAKIMKRIIWLLCILLVLSGAGLAIVSAAPQDDSTSLELYKNHAKDNEPFQVSNMVPGDKVSQDFTVRIHHKDQVTLYFKGLVTKQSKDLGDVLQIRVTDQDSGKVICQGTFNTINNKEYSQEIAQSGSGQTDVTYQVDAWLDTSVGNAYQKAFLDADFQWYVKDDGNTEPTQPSEPVWRRQRIRISRRTDSQDRRYSAHRSVVRLCDLRTGYHHPSHQIPQRQETGRRRSG